MIRCAIILFFVLLFVGPAFGQAPEKRFVGNCSFSGFTLLADSTYRGNITRFDDRMGDGYNLTQLVVGYEIFDGRGLIFEIDTIHSSTNFTADVSVTAKVDRGFEPFGSGQVYNPTASGMIPPSSQEQAGLSPTQKARIDRHNVVTMEALIGGRDSVYSITNVPDTTSLSPVTGDIFTNTAKDTLGFYNGTAWVLFFRGLRNNGLTTGSVGRYDGANGMQNADITDNGTIISIGASRDEVILEGQDSVLVDGPVVNIGAQPTATVRVSDTDQTVTIQAGALEQKIEIDDFGISFQIDGGNYYFPSFQPPVDGDNHVPSWLNGTGGWLNITSAIAGGGDNLGDHTATSSLNMDGNTILGGTGTTDDLTLQSTSGVGGTTSEIIFQVGNAGGTEAMRIRGNGNVGINQSTPAQTLHVSGTARITGSDGTGTRVMLRDADGDISDATLGDGITLTTGTLAANDTVTTLIQDSILVYSLAGTEVARDTVRTPGGDGVTGSAAASQVAYWNGTTTLTGSANMTYTSPTLTLAGTGNSLLLTPTTTPILQAGKVWFSSSNNRLRWSDGVTEYHAVPWTSWASGYEYTGAIKANQFYTFGFFIGSNSIQSTTGSGMHLNYSGSGPLRLYGGGTTPHMYFGSDGKVGIGTSVPARTLHVTGEARITDLTTDTPVRVVGADADGDLGEMTAGPGISFAEGVIASSFENASYYEETERQYTLTTTGADTIITVDTITLAIATDSISMSSGLIENLKSDTVRWQVSYDFFYDSDEDACYSLMDLTSDGTEEPTAIPGSSARGEATSLNGVAIPGRTFHVDVPPGEKIRLCVKGSVGVATSMNISYLTISIQEINR